MTERKTTTVGSRGTVVIPADLRRRPGLEEASPVIAEPRKEGLLLRPATGVPLDTYGPERTGGLQNAAQRRATPVLRYCVALHLVA